MYGNKPNLWSSNLKDVERLRFIVNCFTRMRYCDDAGRLDFNHSGPVGSQPKGLKPWFALPNRKNANLRIIFGHWSTLGYYKGHNCYCIDSGCLWGGSLTALHIGENIYRIDCEGERKPGPKKT